MLINWLRKKNQRSWRSRRIIGIAHDLSCPDAIKLKRLNQLFHAQRITSSTHLYWNLSDKKLFYVCSTEWIGCMVIIIFLVDFLSWRDFKNYRPPFSRLWYTKRFFLYSQQSNQVLWNLFHTKMILKFVHRKKIKVVILWELALVTAKLNAPCYLQCNRLSKIINFFSVKNYRCTV